MTIPELCNVIKDIKTERIHNIDDINKGNQFIIKTKNNYLIPIELVEIDSSYNYIFKVTNDNLTIQIPRNQLISKIIDNDILKKITSEGVTGRKQQKKQTQRRKHSKKSRRTRRHK